MLICKNCPIPEYNDYIKKCNYRCYNKIVYDTWKKIEEYLTKDKICQMIET